MNEMVMDKYLFESPVAYVFILGDTLSEYLVNYMTSK